MSDIQTLTAERDVVRVCNELFVAVDNLDWPVAMNCMTKTIYLEMTGAEPGEISAKALTENWQDGLGNLDAVHHQTGNYIVDVVGFEARVFCNGIAHHFLEKARPNAVRTFVGTYDFHLIRRNEGWKIDRFKFDLKFMNGNLNLGAAE